MSNNSLSYMWNYMWHLNAQCKAILKMDFNRILRMNASMKDEMSVENNDNHGSNCTTTGGNHGSGGGNGNGRGGMDVSEAYGMRQRIGLIAGPLLFIIITMLPLPEGLAMEGKAAAAVAVWMAAWWISEAIPIPVTSLLPIVLFPLTGALSIGEATAPYADKNVFLFLGGFLIAVTIERWNLHKRIALNIIKVIGTSPNMIVLGFMVATGFLSMWISNTATAVMMMPIGFAVILQISQIIKEKNIPGISVKQGEFNFGTCLMLGIAYSASIGGVATLIGTPPNIIFAGVAEQMFGYKITFDTWFKYGLPISVIFLMLTWFYLTHIAFPSKLGDIPGGRQVIIEELNKLGPFSRQEKAVAVVFLLTALAWILRSFVLVKFLPNIDDTIIAMLGALVLFLIPVNFGKGEFLLDWSSAVKVPWGILLLFGGGLSLAAAFKTTGLAEWIGMRLAGMEGMDMLVVMFAVVTLVIFLTEMTSNTASTSMLMPIMASMAVGMMVHPFALMVTACTAASFAFMLPVATPPNAVVFGSGYITIPQMAKAGVWLNIAGIIVITLVTYFWLPAIWGININTFPTEWLSLIK